MRLLKDREGESRAKKFYLLFLNKRHTVGRHLGPDGVFMKIFASCKIKTVIYTYYHAILLFVAISFVKVI